MVLVAFYDGVVALTHHHKLHIRVGCCFESIYMELYIEGPFRLLVACLRYFSYWLIGFAKVKIYTKAHSLLFSLENQVTNV